MRAGKGSVQKMVQSLKFFSGGTRGWTCSEGTFSSWPPGGSRQPSKLSRYFGLAVSEDHGAAGYPPDVNPMQRTNAVTVGRPPWSTGTSLLTLHTACISDTALTCSCLHSASGLFPVPSGWPSWSSASSSWLCPCLGLLQENLGSHQQSAQTRGSFLCDSFCGSTSTDNAPAAAVVVKEPSGPCWRFGLGWWPEIQGPIGEWWSWIPGWVGNGHFQSQAPWGNVKLFGLLTRSLNLYLWGSTDCYWCQRRAGPYPNGAALHLGFHHS